MVGRICILILGEKDNFEISLTVFILLETLLLPILIIHTYIVIFLYEIKENKKVKNTGLTAMFVTSLTEGKPVVRCSLLKGSKSRRTF